MIIYISDVFYSFRYAKSSHLCQASIALAQIFKRRFASALFLPMTTQKKIHGLAIGFLYNRMKRLSLYLEFSPKRKAAAFH